METVQVMLFVCEFAITLSFVVRVVKYLRRRAKG